MIVWLPIKIWLVPLLIGGVIFCLTYLIWRFIKMNANELLFKIIDKLLDKVDGTTFWETYGDTLVPKIIDILFPE